MIRTTVASIVFSLLIAGVPSSPATESLAGSDTASNPQNAALVALGRQLFFDVNLSLHRNQSCATCHDPASGFADSRESNVAGAASLGSDGQSLGDRNTPSIAYAASTPDFAHDEAGNPVGGQFLDGRARDLPTQALEPLVNPLEMAMPDTASIRARIQENPSYLEAMKNLFGPRVFDDPDVTTAGIARAIAAFERTQFFRTFDSKYDRFLRGETDLTPLEEMGRSLFFSPMTNCASCHAKDPHATDLDRETFTNFQYRNIAIPVNRSLRAANGLGSDHVDVGAELTGGAGHRGKFRVPTLRNVAITGPYMHNGVFTKLETAIEFYNQFIVSNRQTQINPETQKPWGPPEVATTVDRDLLREGQPMDAQRIKALVAFLRTLTDARYESLLNAE